MATADDHQSRRRRWASTALVVPTLLAMSGCGFGGDDGSSPSVPAPEATEEFGMTERQLELAIVRVETAIAACMTEAGWSYTPLAPEEVTDLMASIHSAPGLSDEAYLEKYGYGISTQPFQVAGARVFGANVSVVEALPSADREAYERELLGTSRGIPTPTFVVALDAEDFARSGGCTRTAVAQVFQPEELSATYLNPVDGVVARDPRVQEAMVSWAECMEARGLPTFDQELAEHYLRTRLAAILAGRRDLAALSEDDRAALEELQAEERSIAVADDECAAEHTEAIVEAVELQVTGIQPD